MHADIVVLPGDGIGPEVTAAAVEVLQAIAHRYGHRFALHEQLIGGAAIDATGKPLPDATLAAARDADAVLLGAVGGPLIVGRMIAAAGPDGYWIYIGALMALLAAYAAWRMTRRDALPVSETGGFGVIAPGITPVAAEATMEAAQDDTPSDNGPDAGPDTGPDPAEGEGELAPEDYTAEDAEAICAPRPG